MSKRERISSVDNAWLRMDRPTNLMMIVGVMIFGGRIDFQRLRQKLDQRLLTYRRFRQKAVSDATGGYWEDDDLFDIDFQVQRTALPAPSGKDTLQRYVAELKSTPLDPSKPLWQFQLVEDYDGGSALIVRIHHSIADGIALIGVMLNMTDESPEGSGHPLHASEPGEPAAEDAEEDGLWRQIAEPLSEAVVAGLKVSGTLWEKYRDVLQNPQKLVDYARVSGAVATELAKLAVMPDDSRTRFKGALGVAKRVAWSEPMPLDEIKAVGKALDCSVNDLLLSSVAGALRAYLIRQGEEVAGVEVRAMVPVNLRPPEQEHKLGNRFGLVTLLLPLGIENPIARLFEVRRRMEELKGSYQAAVALGLLGVVGLCPKAVQDQVLDLLAAKATAVMTNVPGPQKQLYLAGAPLSQMMFWVPQTGDIGIGVSILSYNGRVQMGLITDRNLVAEPQKIVDRFRPEFEKVLYALLLEPWDGRPRTPREIEADLLAAAGGKPAKKTVRRPAAAKPPASPAAKSAKPRKAAAPAKGKPAARKTRRTAAKAEAAEPAQPRVPKRFR
ncbi:MAG TPA: wax ester/triacylglycerol synthase family O-acyltransferase [Rhodocyclaceae bacterium]|nr:wax ester/triacylglycerol synthase family O-acyltransferase [Rhodocyclaceae bacterium]